MPKITFYFLLTLLIIKLQTYPDESCKISPNLPPFFSIPEVPYTFNETYTVVELDASTGAKCLDGSNYKFYLSKGSGSGVKKFMFYWEGGAFCGVDGRKFLESCLERSHMFLGSSLQWGENGSSVTENFPVGFFSNMQEYNPDFWNWNKVLIKYCDGSNHQGYVEDPIVVNGQNVWFRGFNNTLATFNYVRDNFNLFDSSEVIISGGSAGGQATYLWAPYLQKYFPNNIKLMGIPDAGLFLDVYNHRAGCRLFLYLNKKVATYTNSKQLELFSDCKYKQKEIWKCMMPEYIIMNINFPFFVINSQNDIEALKTQAGVQCIVENPKNCSSEDKVLIHNFRRKFLEISLKIKAYKSFWGFWLRSCFEHIMAGSWAWYGKSKNVLNFKLWKKESLRDGLSYWYNNINSLKNNTSYFSDIVEWYDNETCK